MATNLTGDFPIRVEQTRWQIANDTLSSIRREVFIEVQGVSEEEEWDDKDYDAFHWIAWGPDRVAMATARLVGNKIGRMAVLAPYRDKGVGSAIVKAIVSHAKGVGMDSLILDAQCHAVGFYERLGFRVTGDEFMDAGIPHLPMSMTLSNLTSTNGTGHLQDEQSRTSFRGSEDFAIGLIKVVHSGSRQLHIFSERLLPDVYGRDELCSAVLALAVSHPLTQVRVLVHDLVGMSHHPFLTMCRRLQSRIEVRGVGESVGIHHREFTTADDAFLYVVDPGRSNGFYSLHSPATARRLNNDFDTLWQYGEPDQEFRRLYM